ncbi:phosphatidylinositol-binding clathrin assembly protein lap [Anaeramoeba flamelloides]|uniref:Phosphatidylinositol-binding clathrin assembly protein lap n=1 Tax=Anaeramoeba flamelloides TaxID=1746091 RepID=A0AAV7ZNX2_9EUKA|nr:phosphatidylinositol-binding clathrin assembly protein lap [Anaeramoeba flamelloides]
MSLKNWVKNKTSLVTANSEIEIRIVKATNHDFVIPKKKHVEYLKKQTHVIGAINGQMVRLLSQRLRKKSYVLVFKSLLLLHSLMNDGHKNFISTFASKQAKSDFFGLSHFKDLSTPKAFEYNEFIQLYSSYLEEKLVVYHKICFSINQDIPKSAISTKYKSSGIPKIIKELPSFQEMLRLILKCQVGEMLKDPLFREAYTLLHQDLLKLNQLIKDASSKINESFFKLKKTSAEKCFKIYKKYLQQTIQIKNWQQFSNSKYNIYTQNNEEPEESQQLINKMANYLQNLIENQNRGKNSQDTLFENGHGGEYSNTTGSESNQEKTIIIVNNKDNNSQTEEKEINLFELGKQTEKQNINNTKKNQQFNPFRNQNRCQSISNVIIKEKENNMSPNNNSLTDKSSLKTKYNPFVTENDINHNPFELDNTSCYINTNYNNIQNNFNKSSNYYNNNFNKNNTPNYNFNHNNMSNRFRDVVGQNFYQTTTNSKRNWDWEIHIPYNNNNNQRNTKTNPFLSTNSKINPINNNPFLPNNQSKINEFKSIATKIGKKKKKNDQFKNLVDFTNFK